MAVLISVSIIVFYSAWLQKPQNLLVNSNCDLRICDFGLSRIDPSFLSSSEEDRAIDSGLTGYVQTRWYRAPEVLMSGPWGASYGPAADIWSVGMIMLELILRN